MFYTKFSSTVFVWDKLPTSNEGKGIRVFKLAHNIKIHFEICRLGVRLWAKQKHRFIRTLMTRLLLSKNAPTDEAIASRREIVTSLEVRLVHMTLIIYSTETVQCREMVSSMELYQLTFKAMCVNPPPPLIETPLITGLLWSFMNWPSRLIIWCATPPLSIEMPYWSTLQYMYNVPTCLTVQISQLNPFSWDPITSPYHRGVYLITLYSDQILWHVNALRLYNVAKWMVRQRTRDLCK